MWSSIGRVQQVLISLRAEATLASSALNGDLINTNKSLGAQICAVVFLRPETDLSMSVCPVQSNALTHSSYSLGNMCEKVSWFNVKAALTSHDPLRQSSFSSPIVWPRLKGTELVTSWAGAVFLGLPTCWVSFQSAEWSEGSGLAQCLWNTLYASWQYLETRINPSPTVCVFQVSVVCKVWSVFIHSFFLILKRPDLLST